MALKAFKTGQLSGMIALGVNDERWLSLSTSSFTHLPAGRTKGTGQVSGMIVLGFTDER
jgi:uncharacterized protein YgfB (UPF0149 family)